MTGLYEEDNIHRPTFTVRWTVSQKLDVGLKNIYVGALNGHLSRPCEVLGLRGGEDDGVLGFGAV
jgi:hypothetical protein